MYAIKTTLSKMLVIVALIFFSIGVLQNISFKTTLSINITVVFCEKPSTEKQITSPEIRIL